MGASSLLGDVGGTNARFAISKGPGELSDVCSFKAADYPNFDDALLKYLADRRSEGDLALEGVCIAAAGPVEAHGAVSLTNSPWQISQAGLRKAAGVTRARLFNDLEAVALALPHLKAADWLSIGNCADPPLAGNLIAINVGTGFGAAIAVKAQDGSDFAVATEPGHMTFAPLTDLEAQLRDGLTSIEDLLSGQGVVDAYRKLAKSGVSGEPSALTTAAEVFASIESSPAAAKVFAAFDSLLARVSGDLVLATGSWGGCYFCGSVANGWVDNVDAKQFRSVFVEKGKMAARMKQVPTRVIRNPQPALLGLSYA